MLRTAIAGSLVGIMLATGLTVGLPAATAGDADFGRVWRDNGVLRSGCHDYKYRYRAKPRTNVWALETFLRDPSGDNIASDVVGSGADRKRGTSTFRFCRWNTEPGRFKIRGKLTWYVTQTEKEVRWVKPDHFRLRRAG